MAKIGEKRLWTNCGKRCRTSIN